MNKELVQCPICLGNEVVWEPFNDDSGDGHYVNCSFCEGAGKVSEEAVEEYLEEEDEDNY
jgi:hypothetical protein